MTRSADGAGSAAPAARKPIRHLVMQGGGGKGLAYVGAVEALTEAGVLRFKNVAIDSGADGGADGIQSVAGASAGAITAMCIGCGMDHRDIAAFMARIRFTAFFDSSASGLVRGLGWVGQHEAVEPVRLADDGYVEEEGVSLVRIGPGVGFSLITGRSATVVGIIDRLVGAIMWIRGASLLRKFAKKSVSNRQLVEALGLDDPIKRRRLISAFLSTWGLFPGMAPDQAMTDLLFEQAQLRGSSGALISRCDDEAEQSEVEPETVADYLDSRGWGPTGSESFSPFSFADHYRVFGAELVVTGTNLTTQQSVIFAARTTPRFPVARAVRISMGLPIIFAPVRIGAGYAAYLAEEGELEAADYEGTWFDGGYLDNLPVDLFEPESTLALRLTKKGEEKREIKGFMDYFKAYFFDLGVFGSGNSRNSRSRRAFHRADLRTVVEIDCGELGLLDFEADEKMLRPVLEKAKKAVADALKAR